jgi:hypothetical protein
LDLELEELDAISFEELRDRIHASELESELLGPAAGFPDEDFQEMLAGLRAARDIAHIVDILALDCPDGFFD